MVPILNQGFRWQLRVRPFANLVVPEFLRAAFVFLLRLCGHRVDGKRRVDALNACA